MTHARRLPPPIATEALPRAGASRFKASLVERKQSINRSALAVRHPFNEMGRIMPAFTRVSAVRDDTDQWQIDPAEEFIPGVTPPPLPAEHDAMLNELVKLLREQLENMRAQVADLRQDRDHWREAFEATQRRSPGASAAGLLHNSLAQVDAACEALRASHRATIN
jgi:hypothetical protein